MRSGDDEHHLRSGDDEHTLSKVMMNTLHLVYKLNVLWGGDTHQYHLCYYVLIRHGRCDKDKASTVRLVVPIPSGNEG